MTPPTTVVTQLAAAVPHGPLISPWVVLPAAGILLLILGAHMNSLLDADMPPSRRRIRIVNGWLMLLAIPLLAFAFGAASPRNARLFVLVWFGVVSLLGVIVMLAGLDILNTQRLHRAARRELRREIRETGVLARSGLAIDGSHRDRTEPPGDPDRDVRHHARG